MKKIYKTSCMLYGLRCHFPDLITTTDDRGVRYRVPMDGHLLAMRFGAVVPDMAIYGSIVDERTHQTPLTITATSSLKTTFKHGRLGEQQKFEQLQFEILLFLVTVLFVSPLTFSRPLSIQHFTPSHRTQVGHRSTRTDSYVGTNCGPCGVPQYVASSRTIPQSLYQRHE